jgi:hypothetical protein
VTPRATARLWRDECVFPPRMICQSRARGEGAEAEPVTDPKPAAGVIFSAAPTVRIRTTGARTFSKMVISYRCNRCNESRRMSPDAREHVAEPVDNAVGGM